MPGAARVAFIRNEGKTERTPYVERKMRLTRFGARVFLIAGLVGLIPAAVLAGAQAAPPAPHSFALGHSVVVIGPNSPMFDTLLERWFPGVTSVKYFNQLKPLLAIVHNNTKRAVKAYVVKWTITNADGSTSTALLPAMQEPLDVWEPAGARTVLGPAGTGRGSELVSPFFGSTRKGFDSLEPAGLVSIPFSSAAREPLVRTVQNATNMQVTLDGAIFGDGVFVGPDTSKLYERFQAAQKAETDEGAWVLSQLNSDVAGQSLMDGLSKQIYAGRNASGTDSGSLYVAERGREAERLLNVLERRGRPVLKIRATRLALAKHAALSRAHALDP